MRCEDAYPLISAGLDQELDEGRVAQLRDHVAECALCSRERDALAETVRMLRDLPEAEPPPELRRRIRIALLEAERAGEGRRFGLVWLRPPRVPALAWGAALGGAVAVVIAVAPRPSTRQQHVAFTPAPTPAAAVRLARPNPPAVHHEMKTARLPKKPALAGAPHLQASVTASLPPTPTMPSSHDAFPATPPEPTVAPARHARLVRSHPEFYTAAAHRISPKKATVTPVSPAAGSAPVDRSPQDADDASHLAQSPMPASADPNMPSASSGDSTSDTNGMTLMASGQTMPAPPETPPDDLTELRRRLDDRPLQIPELGQLKPASGPHSNHDGWIRF